MEEKLKSFLSKFKLMDEDEIDYSISLFENKLLKKNDYFVSDKKVCHHIGFILEGGVRTFSIDEQGEENITCFKFENQFVTSFESFISAQVPKINIQAIEDCNLLIINRSRFKHLPDKVPAWKSIQNLLIQQEFTEKENYLIHFKNKPAKEKYQNMLEVYPQIVQRANVNDIASYLGITQRTLTRVKNEISNSQL